MGTRGERGTQGTHGTPQALGTVGLEGPEGADATPAAWRPGAVVARTYEVGAEVGADATGVWHRVFHRGWRRGLLVKSPLPAARAGSAEVAALLAEARGWLELPAHPHLLGCHFVHVVAGLPRVFAEDAPGTRLSEALRDGRVASVENVLDVAVQLAWGLRAVHEAGAVHGAVRAADVLLAEDGTAKLAGFTPSGHAPADDVGAWAGTVREMCTGVPALPEDAVALLDECRAAEPDARPADLGAVAERLIATYRRALGRPYPRPAPGRVERCADEWNNIALSLLAADAQEQAEACWRRALEVDPRHPDATFNLGLWQWRAARITDDELVRRLEAVRDAHTGGGAPDGHIPYLLGLAQLERGDVAVAAELLAEAARLAPQDPDVAAALATAARAGDGVAGHRRMVPKPAKQVQAAAMTVDGRYALTGTRDGTLHWWDLERGKCLRTLTDHGDAVRSVALTPDGRRALSGAEDGTVRWWDLDGGECVRTLTGHTGNVLAVAMTPDGRHGLSGGGGDGTVRLWDLRAGRCVAIVDHHETVYAVALTPDARQALSAGGDGALKVWDLRRGKLLRTLTGHADIVYTAAMTADGRRALSGSKDHDLRWWDLTTGECLRTVTAHAEGVFSVALTPDGRHAVSGGFDRTARYWDQAAGRCLRTLDHEFFVLATAVTPDARRIVTGTVGREVWAWSFANPVPAPWSHSRPTDAVTRAARSRELRSRLDEAREQLTGGDAPGAAGTLRRARAIPGYACHPDVLGLWRIAGSHGRRAGFLDLRPVRTLAGPSGMTSAALASGGRRAVSGGWDETVRYWDLTSGACLRVLSGHGDAVTSVAVTPEGDRAVSGSEDDTLRLWDLERGECLRVLSGHEGSLTSVAVTPEGDRALSGSADGTVRWWDLATGECLQVFSGHTDAVSSVAVGRNGCHGVSGSRGDMVRWWWLDSGERGWSDHSSEVLSVAMTPNCRYVLSGEEGGGVHWWRGDKLIGSFFAHTGSVTSVAMTSDASHGLSASADGTLRWWELETGRCRRILSDHDDEVCTVTLTGGAGHALSGSRDGTLVHWALDWDYAFQAGEG